MSYCERLKRAAEFCRENSGWRVAAGNAREAVLLVHNATGQVFVSAGFLPGLR